MITAKEAKEQQAWMGEIEKDILGAIARGDNYVFSNKFYAEDTIKTMIIPILTSLGYTAQKGLTGSIYSNGVNTFRVYVEWKKDKES